MGRKIRDWRYANADGCTVGLMRCCSCGNKIIAGEFRYYETSEAYVCQCYNCGHTTDEWQRHVIEEKEHREKYQASLEVSTLDVLIKRIKEAYFEAWNEGWDIEEDWENSHAKEVYDALIAKMNRENGNDSRS